MFFAESAYAQLFEIKNASKLYDVMIDTQCEQNECGGEAEVKLLRKGSNTVVQTFHTEELSLYLSEQFKPSIHSEIMKDEQGVLFFDDFNFDGTEDFAIQNGNNGPYGSPVYDIYVFNQSNKKFVLSRELTALTQENIGMFEVNHQNKRIKVMTKDGCCYHIWSEYEVIPKKGLLLVREFIEAVVIAGDKVEVTDRNLVKGKWKEKTKYYPVDQYYK